MRATRVLKLCALLLIVATGVTASAIPPYYMPDTEVANQPIVVIAKWEGEPVKDHSKVEGDVAYELETRTKIHILRTVKGGIKPGIYSIMVGGFIGWQSNGYLMSFTSTEMGGDVQDVREPNIWFLSSEKSWDSKDPGPFLSLTNYRCVQPTVLESFYKELDNPIISQNLSPFLTSASDLIVTRALRVINGDMNPWPFREIPEDLYLINHTANHLPIDKPMRRMQYADAVWRELDRHDLYTRQYALAVYCSMLGASASARVREVTSDKNTTTALIAAGYLASWEDADSIPLLQPTISRALNSKDSAINRVFQDLSDRIVSWNDTRLIPSLIALLNVRPIDGFTWGDPTATRAQKALLSMTGFEFPLNRPAKEMLSAWEDLKSYPMGKRTAMLLGVLGPANPFETKLKRDKASVWLVITNQSDASVVLNSKPFYTDLAVGNSTSYGSSELNYTAIWLDQEKLGNPPEQGIVLKPRSALRYQFAKRKPDPKNGLSFGTLLFAKGKSPATLTMNYDVPRGSTTAWFGSLKIAFTTSTKSFGGG